MIFVLKPTRKSSSKPPRSSSSRKEHFNVVSDSEDSVEDEEDDGVFRPGDAIEVTAGVYCGRFGVVRKTPVKWIPVTLHATSNHESKETALKPTSLRKVRKSTKRTHQAERQETASSPKAEAKEAPKAKATPKPKPEPTPPSAPSQVNDPLLSLPGCVVSDSEDSVEDEKDDGVFRPGDAIEVTAGVYYGRFGIVRKTPVKWIPVTLHATSTHESKETALKPTSLRKVRKSTKRTHHADRQETASSPKAKDAPKATPKATTKPEAKAKVKPPMSGAAAPAPSKINNCLLSLPGYQHDRCLIVPNNKVPTYGPTLASKVFDLVNFCLPVSKDSPALAAESTQAGHKLELVATKIHSHREGPRTVYTVTAHYCVAQEGLLQTLEDYAAFGLLPPRKVASRLELLFTPASKMKNNQTPVICDDLTTDHVEMLPEDDCVYSDGCGFAPRWLIVKLFGNGIDGERNFAFMVRILAPQLGLVKGLLMEKNNIDKIQLHPSMIKVPPSRRNVNSKKVILLAGLSYPSKTSLQVGRLFIPEKAPCKSFQPNKLEYMAKHVLETNQIPESVIEKYVGNVLKQTKALKHAFVVGAADPTNAIPPGHVFVTGFDDTLPDYILVTRFPCTEAGDLLKLPLVKTQPDEMPDDQWQFLKNVAFGAILFGNPGNEHLPLPPMIADGDLDGDLYMVLWNSEMLSYVPVTDTTRPSSYMQVSTTPNLNEEWNTDWLNDAQNLMRDIGSLYLRQTLIGKLHNLWKESTDPYKRVAFGRAYKDAIDIGKHGGNVSLPRDLWPDLTSQFHDFLVDVNYTEDE